ncbi:MAG: restriction endonuclease subunit S, partial [Sodaliphilus sp.]|nr:restriction endonuclease subunit S [Sodaliphilus sp.]
NLKRRMEWKITNIGSLCDRVCSGGTPKSTNNAYYNGNIPWLNTKEVNFNRIYDTEKNITQLGLENSSAKWISENSVIVAMYGATAGKVAITKIPITTNQACCNLSINSEIADYNFVYYFLCSKFYELSSLANGGAQQNLNAQIIKDFPIKIPVNLSDQKKIAGILSALDSKIENNNKINANLEAQAQALFKSWFVDFTPFKDQPFVDSELGPIPQGWKVGKINEFVDVIYGAPYKSKLFNTQKEGLPLIRIRDLKTCSPQFYTKELLPNTELVNYGDVVAGMDAEFTPHIWLGETGLLNQRVCKFKPHTGISPLYSMLMIKPKLEFAQNYKVGTTVSHLGKSDIDKFIIIVPPLDIVKEVSSIFDAVLNEQINLAKENQRLAALRDTLLPKLMSGEIKL